MPVEIKLTATPRAGHLRPLERFRALAGEEGVGTGVLVCRVPESRPLANGHVAMPWSAFPGWLQEQVER